MLFSAWMTQKPTPKKSRILAPFLEVSDSASFPHKTSPFPLPRTNSEGTRHHVLVQIFWPLESGGLALVIWMKSESDL
ncbi:hypothetical protein PsYK624_068090 [Phanerochaete sordida]|uniref:Uncharacterized protein n=1 Tax=Phanerochaete sordida TaxID=48140 RepID=A0A9P3G9Y4_9APHY|nr:hypothetical protein PsYK624_068090 [Phanerochaete sordida]